jgi:hypothetical protein
MAKGKMTLKRALLLILVLILLITSSSLAVANYVVRKVRVDLIDNLAGNETVEVTVNGAKCVKDIYDSHRRPNIFTVYLNATGIYMTVRVVEQKGNLSVQKGFWISSGGSFSVFIDDDDITITQYISNPGYK